VERLCDVVVGAAREPANAIGMLGLGAEHDDRQVGIPRVVDGVAAPDAAADVEAAHVGQQHVQQHNVGTGAAEHLERLLAVGRGQHRVVIGAQVLDEKVHDTGLVIHDEHGRSSHGHGSLGMADRTPENARYGGGQMSAPRRHAGAGLILGGANPDWKNCNGGCDRSRTHPGFWVPEVC
jgi:hypothetical protein